MGDKNLNDYIAVYSKLLDQGDIQIAYSALLRYMWVLKANFHKKLGEEYSFGNISPGYMDFTYFPFFNDFLRSKKLRFGIVLNHQEMRFELWLMGQNAKVQENYWGLLKKTKWNQDRAERPQYSVLETIIVAKPDFNNLDRLTEEIEKSAIYQTEEILTFLHESI